MLLPLVIDSFYYILIFISWSKFYKPVRLTADDSDWGVSSIPALRQAVTAIGRVQYPSRDIRNIECLHTVTCGELSKAINVTHSEGIHFCLHTSYLCKHNVTAFSTTSGRVYNKVQQAVITQSLVDGPWTTTESLSIKEMGRQPQRWSM